MELSTQAFFLAAYKSVCLGIKDGERERERERERETQPLCESVRGEERALPVGGTMVG